MRGESPNIEYVALWDRNRVLFGNMKNHKCSAEALAKMGKDRSDTLFLRIVVRI